MIDCQGGQIKMAGGRIIHDDKADHYRVITVHEALEHSSDVAAVKLALKMGPENFYKYIHDFGFGSRTGTELPGETRGLLRAPNRWGSSSIGSIAIGQEVGVTPIQLVSMVSTIANGGVYLPPHVFDCRSRPIATRPRLPRRRCRHSRSGAGGELPDPLPTGAHRVLSELAAAQMRKMMEGVVLFGTGKPAQLNGYSSGGKTGTAQKVDPVTHLYSKIDAHGLVRGHRAGQQPRDRCRRHHGQPERRVLLRHGGFRAGFRRSGAAGSRIPECSARHRSSTHKGPAKKDAPVKEDDASSEVGDINALYAAANDLPSDDPLRAAPAPAARLAHRPRCNRPRPATPPQIQSRRDSQQPSPSTSTIGKQTQFWPSPLLIPSSSPMPESFASHLSLGCPFARSLNRRAWQASKYRSSAAVLRVNRRPPRRHGPVRNQNRCPLRALANLPNCPSPFKICPSRGAGFSARTKYDLSGASPDPRQLSTLLLTNSSATH